MPVGSVSRTGLTTVREVTEINTWGPATYRQMVTDAFSLSTARAEEFPTRHRATMRQLGVAAKQLWSSWGGIVVTYICPAPEYFDVSGYEDAGIKTLTTRCVEKVPPKMLSQEEVHDSLIQSFKSFQKEWSDYKKERARRIEALVDEDTGSDL